MGVLLVRLDRHPAELASSPGVDPRRRILVRAMQSMIASPLGSRQGPAALPACATACPRRARKCRGRNPPPPVPKRPWLLSWERERTGASVLGIRAILACDPLHRPSALARSPAPRVHAATKAARRAFYEIYAAFVGAFREASERLRRGDRNAPFPTGSFPPALPFVAG